MEIAFQLGVRMESQTNEPISVPPPVEGPALTSEEASPSSAKSDVLCVESRGAVELEKEWALYLEFGEQTHSYVSDFIKQADQKAAFFFAGWVAMLAYLNSNGLSTIWATWPCEWSFIEFWLRSVISLIVGCWFCLHAIMPRLKGNAKGHVFFNGIASHANATKYAEEIYEMTPSDICKEKFKHTFEISKICKTKFERVVIGFWFGFVGLVLALLLVAFKSSQYFNKLVHSGKVQSILINDHKN